MAKNIRKITVVKNGPYLVTGRIPLTERTIIANEKGRSVEWRETQVYPDQETYALCRCGRSKDSPFCDGTHEKMNFLGKEIASKEDYASHADRIEGPELILTDDARLCAYARFCHRKEGDVWDLIEESEDSQLRESAIKATWECPAGRLVAWDRQTGEAIEEELEPSISIIEDPPIEVSGPIWVRGGIPIESSDGSIYEVRNQVTLCRCGRSRNMPFCDGTHAAVGFKAKAKAGSDNDLL